MHLQLVVLVHERLFGVFLWLYSGLVISNNVQCSW